MFVYQLSIQNEQSLEHFNENQAIYLLYNHNYVNMCEFEPSRR
jgi:hypothetical protein